SAVTAGNSIVDACREVRTKLTRAAAVLLEAAPEDVEIADGRVFVKGSPGSAVDLARVIQASIPTFAKPGVASPDFEASAYHHVPTVTYASAVHVAQVEVDPASGRGTLLRDVVAHDCGRGLHARIVAGQGGAAHVAEVEVDAASGRVTLLRYVVAHDCGRVINPLIVEGQVHGGVAQGVGGALFEEMVYDEQGQLLTGTLMDYLVPTATD